MEDLKFLQAELNQSTVSPSHERVVILVEDDETVRQTIAEFLQLKCQYRVQSFSSPTHALNFLDKTSMSGVYCLLTDMSFQVGEPSGLQFIDSLRDRGQLFFSLVMTGFGSIENAVSATKRGVFHYLTKPFSLDSLRKVINEGFLQHNHHMQDMFCGMIGRSPKMKEVFDQIQKVANSEATVLITGPSGTGKELVAHALHNLSPRSIRPFVPVNCGSIPKDLLESELFGHLKGSFTGAISNRKGRFELAEKGSIFLDEIGDMPLQLQVKLLRVLQKKEIDPIGGQGPIKVDVRIIAATHRDLEKQSLDGHFREDLFYRLNVIPIKIPSLSERKDDLPLLIDYFLSRFVSADGSNQIEFRKDSSELLLNYDWPGNVRELENLIERLVILRGGHEITPEDLPARIYKSKKGRAVFDLQDTNQLPENGIDLKKALNEIELNLIRQAMGKTRGNKNQAAKLLGLNRTTLIEKLKKFEVLKEFDS